jgi:glutathione synthase/RimK-type ligase-like ATP-grasp enzyme
VLHENSEWLVPLRVAFEELHVPYEEVMLDRGAFDLSAPPPPGVYYNRMSASSHTRDHRYAVELTGAYLAWLESYQRRLVNSSRALRLEISKAAQYAALRAAGIATPRTVVSLGREEALAAAASFDGAFIAKHNRGGKGLGVRLFANADALESALGDGSYEAPVDGLLLLQDYVRTPQPYITRMEFVGGRFYYAVRVNTSDGFELCPADQCAPCGISPVQKFEIVPRFTHPLVERAEAFLAGNGIEVAGVEFAEDAAGRAFVYDVNTNTNYNPQAEAAAGLYGMRRLAGFLGDELQRIAKDERAAA